MFTVEHRPEGNQSNIAYVVLNPNGGECHRGPEWACKYRAAAWNEGRLIDDERRLVARIDGLLTVLGVAP